MKTWDYKFYYFLLQNMNSKTEDGENKEPAEGQL